MKKPRHGAHSAALDNVHPSCRNTVYSGYQEYYDQLLHLVEQTLTKGESNSLLVLGPRGVGKTHVVQNVLESVRSGDMFKKNGLIVELNGLVETDDKAALKEITKQLNLENVVGDRVFGSFSEHLDFLLTSLRSGNRQSKPIIFVLDEFDLFCNHHNQTLLYNLFDVAQSRAAPICVIGISVRLDVIEGLEKRVRSRFSHRQIYMLPIESFEEYLKMAKKFLTVGEKSWDKHVDSVLKRKSVRQILEKIFSERRDLAMLKKILFTALLEGQEEDFFSEDHLRAAVEDMQGCDDHIIQSLSMLELCVLIATMHISYIYEGQPFNFEMVFHEYQKFSTRKCQMVNFERSVVMKAWEKLVALELVSPLDKGTKTQKEYKLFHIQVVQSQIMNVVNAGNKIPVYIKDWATNVVHV